MSHSRIARMVPEMLVVALSCLILVTGTVAWAQNVVCTPNPQEISLADLPGGGTYKDEVVVSYTGGGSGAVYGYSIDLTWDPAVITATAGDFAKPAGGPFSTTTWFIPTIISAGHARIDAALPGGSAGTTADDLFKVTFTAVGTPDFATSALTLTLNYFRDQNNVPLTGFSAANGQVDVDLVAPVVTGVAITNNTLVGNDFLKNGDAITVTSTVTDGDPAFGTGNFSANLSGLVGSPVTPTYAGGLATWVISSATCTPSDGTVTVTVTATDGLGNSANGTDTIIADNTLPDPVTGFVAAPGYKKVELSWDDPSVLDDNYVGMNVVYKSWGDYADYGSQPTPTAAPPYPANSGDGTHLFSGSGATPHTHSFTTDDRDIYYYAAFAYDEARNRSLAAASCQDRATNYWLGDVSDGTVGQYDGNVNTSDYTALASTYGLNEGETSWNSECDVGPTDTFSRVGIPTPDDQVQFEDLMIFSMNAGVVGPTKAAPTGTAEPVLAWEQIDERIWSLQLVEPCADFKGVNVTARVPAGSVEVTAGDLLGQQQAPVFLKNIDRLGLDAGLALMGQDLGIIGSGELLRVTLAEGSDLDEAKVMARGIDNKAMDIDQPALPDASLPMRFGLDQNSPNPFNPMTKIMFHLPEGHAVRLSIYTMDGRLVCTLLNEERPAGANEVIWDGRDDSGRQAASGTYMYRLDAGPYSATKKMSLMK